MIGALAKRLFGTANNRHVRALKKSVSIINALEPQMRLLSDNELRDRTSWLRERLAKGESLDDIMHDAFATVREAARRTLGQRHFDVQIIGGIVLHQGMIAEMKTGEGKTLASTLPVYLNALPGKGVHVVTVNDYLARRDAEWMGAIYQALDISVGCIMHDSDDLARRETYALDITYATNNELGFDYLRDNMKFRIEDRVQRGFHYAIIDEVDSILIDEARTPLIISGPAEGSSQLYEVVDGLIPQLSEHDYEKDEKARTVTLTDSGTEAIEDMLKKSNMIQGSGLYDLANISYIHHVNQALRAHKLFTRDADYIVKDNHVVIIDEFTGRMMEGRRYSEGLHQAIEAKERVPIQKENQTLASITFQNYFRLYPKLAGMTGTAMTEAEEFSQIYSLSVVDIPSNLPVARKDEDDEVYCTTEEKWEAIVRLIEDCQQKQQPVLVGTVSIEKSEHISKLLEKKSISHKVLNARYHEQEAHIVAQAGCPGAITIATNMAGRGTDIQLGGNLDMRLADELSTILVEEDRKRCERAVAEDIARKREMVRQAGGLYVVGTERHESRRIDNQLRGRSGRQGDPGQSRFFLSLEDDLMRIFGSERIDALLKRLGLQEGEAIIHPWINKALERAQQKVEARNFEIRKQLLKFDNVMNDQRRVIYEQRREFMQADDVSGTIEEMSHDILETLISHKISEQLYPDQWDIPGLHAECMRLFNLDLPLAEWAREEGVDEREIQHRIENALKSQTSERVTVYGEDLIKTVQKSLLLQILDYVWKDHLLQLDYLRQGINLRAYGQRDPLNEYKREAFNLFEEMLSHLRDSVVSTFNHLEIRSPDVEPSGGRVPLSSEMKMHRDNSYHGLIDPALPADKLSAHAHMQRAASPDTDSPAAWGKVPRNAPCPCGSGRKYKHCHGKP